MKSMKKVEIITEAVYVNKVLEIFTKHNISGCTIIKDIEGYGAHGFKTANDVSDMLSNKYIFTVCEEGQYQEMVKDIRSFLKKYGGKCILSDVMLLLGTPKIS